MKLSAVLLARVLVFIEIDDLNPGGTAFLPEIVGGLIHRFNFQKGPATLAEMDEGKGIEFLEGTWNGITVTRLVIFNNVIQLDTQATTADSERIIKEALEWAAEKYGLMYTSADFRYRRYVSDLTFYSDAPILEPSGPLLELCKSATSEIASVFGEQVGSSVPIRLDLDFERFNRPVACAPFSIQRRTDAPFKENKYFSEAPLPTDVHLKLLAAYEASLSGQKAK